MKIVSFCRRFEMTHDRQRNIGLENAQRILNRNRHTQTNIEKRN